MTIMSSDASTTTKWNQFCATGCEWARSGVQVLVVEDDRVVGTAVQRSLFGGARYSLRTLQIGVFANHEEFPAGHPARLG